MPERIDALGAHFYAISQAENALSLLAPRAAVRFGDDRVILIAVDASLASCFLQAIDAYKPFDENLNQLDEKTELLYGDDQRVIFLAEMVLHELRGLPFH